MVSTEVEDAKQAHPVWGRSLACACLCAALCAAVAQPALAVEVGGVKLDETVQLASRELKLNGAGVRYKVIFKVYTIALYLPEKKTQLADILALPGPRRLEIVMLRDITSDELGQAFMQGLKRSSDQADRTRLLSQTMQFGAMFETVPGLKKGRHSHRGLAAGRGDIVQAERQTGGRHGAGTGLLQCAAENLDRRPSGRHGVARAFAGRYGLKRPERKRGRKKSRLAPACHAANN